MNGFLAIMDMLLFQEPNIIEAVNMLDRMFDMFQLEIIEADSKTEFTEEEDVAVELVTFAIAKHVTLKTTGTFDTARMRALARHLESNPGKLEAFTTLFVA